jgi:biopolymer transport protein ExbB
MENNVFTSLATALTNALTHFIHAYSGLLQISVYLVIGLVFFYSLVKCWQALTTLARTDRDLCKTTASAPERLEEVTTLGMIAASFFCQTKRHYLEEKRADPHGPQLIPPDGFIRDAAFQYSERYFEERFLEPISLSANLMPSLGFIGTIIGLVVHFLSNAGALSSNITVAGIATALYTTFVGLVCYTILEFLLKIFSALARRRIDEGLGAAAGWVLTASESREEG